MKIICKVKDFYDYLQGIYPDDSFVFDRRNYYYLRREDILNWCSAKVSEYVFLILTVGYNNYAFKLTTKKVNNYYTIKASDIDIELADVWKDYDNPKLLKIKLVKPYFSLLSLREETAKDLIASKNCRIYEQDDLKLSSWEKVGGRFPILNTSGLVGFLDPQEIYFAIEEYFSYLKEKVEVRESKDLDDVGKIVNHGFDKKVSFRNIK